MVFHQPKMSIISKKELAEISVNSFRADDETRTHTGQRPLPPQSSVSTISPHPHSVKQVFRLLWDCKYSHCLVNSKHFSAKYLNFLSGLFL